MGNRNQPPCPSPLNSRPPGNWDCVFSVVAIGANVYHPASVNPFVNGFRTSMRKEEYSTQTYHILPRCCTLPLDGKKVRLELYTDNGACSSSGALAVDTVAERDGIAIVYDFTFAGSFDFAKKLVQDIEEWRKHSNRSTPVILVGVDGAIGKSRRVEYSTAQQFAEQVSVPLMEVNLNSEVDIEKAHTTLLTVIVNTPTR